MDAIDYGAAPGTSFQATFNFALNDIQGKPFESGTIEVSRSLARATHWHIHSPSLDFDSSAVGEEFRAKFDRESVLVNLAADMLTYPLKSVVNPEQSTVKVTQEELDGVSLECRQMVPAAEKTGPSSAIYCFDPQHHLVLIHADMGLLVRRSNFKLYGDWQIAQHVELSYGGVVAIQADVAEINATRDNAPLETAKATTEAIPGSVMAGRITKKKQPKYPGAAKAAHVQGTVVLCGIIGKEGKITKLEVVASPNTVLAKSALDAVKTWEYQPYLLNGTPTDVETTIAVNYALNTNK